jgi:HNH endonuclease
MGWRHEYLPAHAKRIKDPDAVNAARKDFCEYCCGPMKAEEIHVHHVKSRGAGGHDRVENLVSLCWLCHQKVHEGKIVRARLTALIRKREILRPLIGLTCNCGCQRLRWVESLGEFQCFKCSRQYAP